MEGKPTLNPVLKDFWKAPARVRVLYGGRDSTKSWDAAGMAIFLAQYCKIRFLCTRKFQNKIEESVYSLLKSQIDRFGLTKNFTILKNKIICKSTGSEFIFYGLWRHIDEIKSLEGVDICWIEEAHNLSKNEWDILEPTVRREGSQFWVVFNPRYTTDFAYQRFVVKPPADSIVRLINYLDNPFLSDTSRKVIEAAKEEDYDEYTHKYLGVPRDDDDQVIIKRSWIEAAIDAHKNLKVDFTGQKFIGYDVADSGADKNATALFNGAICMNCTEWKAKEDELTKSTKRVRSLAGDDGTIIYDSIGVGAHTGSTLNELGFNKHFKFNAGAKVFKPSLKYEGIRNRDFFSNLKSQAWWLIADRFRNTYNAINKGQEFDSNSMISISSDCDNLNKLLTELSTPRKDFDKLGKVKVESKDDLKKREVVSPNLADAFIMGASIQLVSGSAATEINIRGF